MNYYNSNYCFFFSDLPPKLNTVSLILVDWGDQLGLDWVRNELGTSHIVGTTTDKEQYAFVYDSYIQMNETIFTHIIKFKPPCLGYSTLFFKWTVKY